MKLDYVPEGSVDAPLVRLYDFDVADADQLKAVFASLATKAENSIPLHALDFIDAVSDCQLTLTANPWDQGLVKTAEPATFRCALTPGTWENIAGLTEPFTQNGVQGFQWLNEADISLLISHDGHW